MAKRARDEQAREALAVAIKAFIEHCGGQEYAADRVGVTQPQMSRFLNKIGAPQLETLIGLRAALEKSIDEILGLPPIGEEPAEDAPLDEVLKFYRGRWDDLSKDMAFESMGKRPVPDGGWKKTLDAFATALRDRKRKVASLPSTATVRRRTKKATGRKQPKGSRQQRA